MKLTRVGVDTHDRQKWAKSGPIRTAVRCFRLGTACPLPRSATPVRLVVHRRALSRGRPFATPGSGTIGRAFSPMLAHRQTHSSRSTRAIACGS
jgi:hypothetical protein